MTRLLAALCAAMALLAGQQTLRLATAQRDHAQTVAEFNAATARSERQARELTERYRTLEGNYRENLLTVAETYASETRRFMADADRAAAVRLLRGGARRRCRRGHRP